MSIKKPFKRNIRQFTDGSFSEGGRWHYILHKDYADSPEHYIRAFLILQKDFLDLLDFVEPSDTNLKTYSFRIHELLLRVCIEIEANFVAILSENGYKKNDNWNMNDYKKTNGTHKLSSYVVKLPVWKGNRNIRKPFYNWKNNGSLKWYRAYNETKHDRHTEFLKATFEHLTDAMCALVALISSQFMNIDFSPSDWGISAGGLQDGMKSAIGGYFRVKYPTDWNKKDMYEFKWQDLEKIPDPIDIINYK